MRKTYTLLAPARADLKRITYYISNDNPAAARKWRKALFEAFQTLGENPYIGQQRDDLTLRPVRFWPIQRHYMIIYDPASAPVRILRVYNAAQDIAGILPG